MGPEKLGTERIEKIGNCLAKLVVVGKKISSDGKVDATDLAHVLPLLVEVPAFVDAFSHLGKAIDEGKDIDVNEIVSLVQFVHAKVKEVEAA